MAANDIKNKTASIYIDDQPAQDAYDRLIPKAEAYNKKIEEGTKKAKFLQEAIQKSLDVGGKPETLQKKLASVNKTLDDNKKSLEKVTAQQKALQQQMDSKSGPSFKQQQQLVSKLENEYKNLGKNTEDAKNKLLELGKASDVLNQMREKLDAVKNVQKESNGGFARVFGNVAEYFTAYAIINKTVGAVKDLFKGSIDEAMQAEEANARFKAQLEGLGRSDAFERLQAAADRIQSKFKNLDNDEITAVFEKLINYGKLTEKQMNDLIPIIADFAAKQRISIGEATDQVTKFIESGKGLKGWGLDAKGAKTEGERLNLVMGDLKEKVTGANDAFLTTTAGGIAAAKQQFKDLKEEIGNRLIPVMNNLLGFINKSLKGLLGLTRSKEIDALQKNRVDDAAANSKIQKIEANIQAKVINPKTGKPVTAKDYVDALQAEVAKATDERQKGILNQVLLHFDTRQLGTGGDVNTNHEADKQKEEDAKKARQKLLDDQKKLDEELLKLQHEYQGLIESEYMKELQAAFDKYEHLKELAHGNKADLQKIEVGFNESIAAINAKYAKKAIDDLNKLDEEKRKLREKQLQDQLKKGFDFLNSVAADVAKDADRKNQLRKAQDDYDIAHASGKKLFDLELKQLDDEEALAVAAARKRGDSVEAVEIEFQKKREELTAGRFEKEVELYLGFAQQVLSILSTFDEGRRNKEAAELGRIQKTHDTEKASYQRMLNSKAISKQQFDKKVAELDAQADKKKQEIEKQQFERNKKIQLAQALVNGALGITSVLAARPGAVDVISLGAFRAINIALTVAATAAQISAIARSKYEGGSKFAKGGHLNGPSHKDGGMPVINPRTGRKEAEVEGGEVILSRKTVSSNKGLVDALLYSSMHKEGARIDPWFKNRTYKAIDFSGISRSIQNVRHYASGGVFTANASDTAQPAQPAAVILPPGFETLPDLLQAVANRLAITPKAYVVYQDLKDADDTIASIKGAATFGKK
jgi:hypothetical protein